MIMFSTFWSRFAFAVSANLTMFLFPVVASIT